MRLCSLVLESLTKCFCTWETHLRNKHHHPNTIFNCEKKYFKLSDLWKLQICAKQLRFFLILIFHFFTFLPGHLDNYVWFGSNSLFFCWQAWQTVDITGFMRKGLELCSIFLCLHWVWLLFKSFYGLICLFNSFVRWPWSLTALHPKKTRAKRQNTHILRKHHQFDNTWAAFQKCAVTTQLKCFQGTPTRDAHTGTPVVDADFSHHSSKVLFP